MRVGFASADFKQKATLYLAFDTFRHLDCSKIEVFVYATCPDELLVPSHWRRHVEQHVEHFVDISAMDPRAASARVAQDRLDVLVDMDGYSNEGLRKSSSSRVATPPSPWRGSSSCPPAATRTSTTSWPTQSCCPKPWPTRAHQ